MTIVNNCRGVLLLLATSPVVTGCAFAQSGMGRPAGHPPLHYLSDDRQLLDGELSQTCTIDMCYYADPTNTSVTNHMPNCGSPGYQPCSDYHGLKNTAGFASSLDSLAAFYKEDLCYWAYQTLPPPQDMETLSYNITDADTDTIFQLGTMANDRYHSLIGNGVMAGGLSTSGTILTTNLCERGVLSGDRCDPKILNQEGPVPAAIQIIRIAAGTAEEVVSNITAWRALPSLHEPNIKWASSDSGGWGYSGELKFKVVRCSDIPESMLSGTKDLTADPLVDGESMHDAMLHLWQGLDSLCPPEQWVVGENATGCALPELKE